MHRAHKARLDRLLNFEITTRYPFGLKIMPQTCTTAGLLVHKAGDSAASSDSEVAEKSLLNHHKLQTLTSQGSDINRNSKFE